MTARIRWTLSTGLCYGLIAAVQGLALSGASGGIRELVYGLGFLGLGVALIGALARWWPAAEPAVWRSAALATGALLAAGLIVGSDADAAGVARIDLWAAAVLGLGIGAVVSRFVPTVWQLRWFGRA